jgi:hypothetical protein
LYVDSRTGGIYIADEGNDRVRYFSNGSSIGIDISSTKAGKYPIVNAIYLYSNGTIYIADVNNQRIYDWLTNQTVAGGNGVGHSDNQFSSPKRFFIDNDLSFYVPDFDNARVQKWSWGAKNGQTVAGGNGDGNSMKQLSQPVAVVIDSQGNLLVCDSRNNRIQKWSPGATEGVTIAGSPTGVAGSGSDELNSSRGIAIDKDDNIYVVDELNRRIQKFQVV